MTEHFSSIGFLLTDDLGFHDTVRKGPIRDSILSRFENWLLKKIEPTTFAVRGDRVAMDTLTEAIVRNGTRERYEIFTHPSLIGGVKSRAVSQWEVPEAKLKVRPTSDLFNPLDNFESSVIITPRFFNAEPFLFRENIPNKLVPVIGLSHGFSLNTMLYGTFLRILLANTYQCDSLVCTSEACKAALLNVLGHVEEQFSRHFGTRLVFAGRIDKIPLCVDTETLTPRPKNASRKLFKLPQDAVILLSMGRISPLKADLRPVLRVFRRLVSKHPQKTLIFVIAGTKDTTYLPKLKEFIKREALSDNVRLIIDVPDQDKAALLSAADIFVAAADSVQESFGLSPVEAMSCGLPQVAADWDGYRDTVKHGETGLLVPTLWAACDEDLSHTGLLYGWEFDHLSLGQSIAMNFEVLERSLDILISNPSLRQKMSASSRHRAEELYSYRSVSGQYEQLCDELAAIGNRLTLKPPRNSFATPSYFDFFKGHSSAIASDDWPLSLTGLGRGVSDSKLEAELDDLCLSSDITKAGLARQIVDDLIRHSSRDISIHGATDNEHSLGAIVERVSAVDRLPKHLVKRHVMWLIKQGFLSIRSKGEDNLWS